MILVLSFFHGCLIVKESLSKGKNSATFGQSGNSHGKQKLITQVYNYIMYITYVYNIMYNTNKIIITEACAT